MAKNIEKDKQNLDTEQTQDTIQKQEQNIDPSAVQGTNVNQNVNQNINPNINPNMGNFVMGPNGPMPMGPMPMQPQQQSDGKKKDDIPFFLKMAISIDESRVSALVIALIATILFAGFMYVQKGDITPNLTQIVTTLIIAISGVNALGSVGGLFSGMMNRNNNGMGMYNMYGYGNNMYGSNYGYGNNMYGSNYGYGNNMYGTSYGYGTTNYGYGTNNYNMNTYGTGTYGTNSYGMGTTNYNVNYQDPSSQGKV